MRRAERPRPPPGHRRHRESIRFFGEFDLNVSRLERVELRLFTWHPAAQLPRDAFRRVREREEYARIGRQFRAFGRFVFDLDPDPPAVLDFRFDLPLLRDQRLTGPVPRDQPLEDDGILRGTDLPNLHPGPVVFSGRLPDAGVPLVHSERSGNEEMHPRELAAAGKDCESPVRLEYHFLAAFGKSQFLPVQLHRPGVFPGGLRFGQGSFECRKRFQSENGLQQQRGQTRTDKSSHISLLVCVFHSVRIPIGHSCGLL